MMIYEDCMKMLPDYWAPMSSDVRYLKIPMFDIFSQEYSHVSSLLKGTYCQYVSGLHRVQNPLLWTKFLLMKRNYQRGEQDDVEIKTLYHDTSFENIESICEFNFDWRMGERFMFGPGVYFSVQPELAARHSSKKNGSLRAMFVVDVLVKNIQRVDEENGIFLPDPGFDTVLAHGDQTYVKYFDSEYYPRYFMIYDARNGFLSQPDSFVNFNNLKIIR